MFLNTVHHVAIIVSNYELSRDFYVLNIQYKCTIQGIKKHLSRNRCQTTLNKN